MKTKLFLLGIVALFPSTLFGMESKEKTDVDLVLSYAYHDQNDPWEFMEKRINKIFPTHKDKETIFSALYSDNNHYYNLLLLWGTELHFSGLLKKDAMFFHVLIAHMCGLSTYTWDTRICTQDFQKSCKRMYWRILQKYHHLININYKPENYVSKSLNQTVPMKVFSEILETTDVQDENPINNNEERKVVLKEILRAFNKKIDLTIHNDDNKTLLDFCTIENNDSEKVIENKRFLRNLIDKYIYEIKLGAFISFKSRDCHFIYMKHD